MKVIINFSYDYYEVFAMLQAFFIDGLSSKLRAQLIYFLSIFCMYEWISKLYSEKLIHTFLIIWYKAISKKIIKSKHQKIGITIIPFDIFKFEFIWGRRACSASYLTLWIWTVFKIIIFKHLPWRSFCFYFQSKSFLSKTQHSIMHTASSCLP